MFKVVRKEGLNTYSWIGVKISSEKLSFINLDRQPSIELAIEPRADTTFKPLQMLAIELAVEF